MREPGQCSAAPARMARPPPRRQRSISRAPDGRRVGTNHGSCRRPLAICRSHGARARRAAATGEVRLPRLTTLHATILRFRRLRRRRHRHAFLAHAHRLQAAWIDAELLGHVIHHSFGTTLGQGAVVVLGASPTVSVCPSMRNLYAARSSLANALPSASSVWIASGVSSAEPLAKLTVRFTAGPVVDVRVVGVVTGLLAATRGC